MARNQSKCVVNNVTIATLKVLTLFSPASLSCKKLSGDTYQVSVPINIIFIMSAFFMLALRISTVYLYAGVMCDPSIPNFSGVTNIVSMGLITWFVCLGSLITFTAVIRARKQMIQQIHIINAMQKILSRFDFGSSLDIILKKAKIIYIGAVLILITITTIDLSISDEVQDYAQHLIFYITYFINDIVVIMVGQQYYLIISIMLLTIQTIDRFLLQYVNNEEKRVFTHRPYREIRTYAGLLFSIYKILNTINNSESVLLLMVFLSEMSDIANHIYLLASAVQLSDTILRARETRIQLLWLTYVTTRIFSLIESGHLLNDELTKTKDILSRILHKLPHKSYYTEEISTLFEQVLLVQPRLAPLEIVTINRKLMLSIVSGSITFLIILVQFQLKETYPLYHAPIEED